MLRKIHLLFVELAMCERMAHSLYLLGVGIVTLLLTPCDLCRSWWEKGFYTAAFPKEEMELDWNPTSMLGAATSTPFSEEPSDLLVGVRSQKERKCFSAQKYNV